MNLTRLLVIVALILAASAFRPVATCRGGSTEAASTTVDPPTLPEPISSFGAARLGDHLYVFGGHTGRTHAHSRANITGEFRRIPISLAGGWESLPGDLAMQGTALVSDGSRLFRIGGLIPRNATADDDPDLHSTDDVKLFDTRRNEWEPFTPLPIRLSSHDAAYLDGRIYVAGGWTLSGDGDGAWNGSAWSLDPGAEPAEWQPLAAPPFRRRGLAVVAAAGRLHVLGGMDEHGELTRDHDIYDPAAESWTEGVDLPEEGFGLAACEVGGRVVISLMSGRHYRLSADGTAWEQAGGLVQPRYFHRIVPAGGSGFVAVAGATEGPHVGTVERADVAVAGASEEQAAVQVVEVPIPEGTARNRQGMFLHDGGVTLFGGNNSAEQHDFEPRNFVDEAWRVDLASREVTRLESFPFKRQSMQTLVVDGGRIGLAFGGFGHDGTVARSHPDIVRHDFETGRWAVESVTLPKPLTQFGLIEHAGDVWAFGGMDFDPARGAKQQFQIQTDVYRWRRAAGGETFARAETDLPRPRRAFGCEVADGKVYLVGGMKQEFAGVEECDVYDIASGTWSQIPAPGKAFISPELAWLDGRLFLACGSTFSDADGFRPNTAVMAFDPQTAGWETVVDCVPQIARHSRLVVDGGRLLIVATVAAPDGGTALRVITLRP